MFDAMLFPEQEKKTLRPHQERAISLLRESIRAGSKRTVLQAPTGFGKTLTASTIIRNALSKGRIDRVMFTVPRISLIGQTVEAFESEGLRHIGVLQGNHPRVDYAAPVQVASVQTLANRVPPYCGMVLVDECHESHKAIPALMEKWPDAYFVGLSATPWAVGMGRVWQDLRIACTTQELIDGGFLKPFRVFAPFTPDMSGVRVSRGDFAEGQTAEIMQQGTLVADVVQTWLEKGENRPTLAFCVNRAHAAHLQEQFERAGVSAGYVDCNTDIVERAQLARRFASGEVKVACSVRTLTTGVDWPVACIIDAAPTRSQMLHVQKIGRGLRVNPPWPDCIVLDHAGNTGRVGFVTDIHHERLNMGEKAEPQPRDRTPLPKECPKCSFMMEPKTRECPACGHERQAPKGSPDIEEGELVELTSNPKAVSIEEKQRWYSGLIWIAEKRGYSLGWAGHKYREKFGVWPRRLVPVPASAAQDIINWEKSRRIAWAKAKARASA